MGTLSDTAQLCFLSSDNHIIHKGVAPGTTDVLLLFIKDVEWELILIGILQQSPFFGTPRLISMQVCACAIVSVNIQQYGVVQETAAELLKSSWPGYLVGFGLN